MPSSFYGGGGSGDSGQGGVGISSALINSSGQLVFTYTDGTTQNVGQVAGSNGATFIPTITDGVLSWTNDQDLENPSPLQIVGIDGVTFTPSLTDGVLSWTNDGNLVNPEPVNLQGENGVTFIPHLDDTILSWTNDGGLPNPEPFDFAIEGREEWFPIGDSEEFPYGWNPIDSNDDNDKVSEYTWNSIG